MMNRLRNNASPASTWFGGTLLSPSALRVIESTTKIFENDVHSSSSAGATDSTVSARMMTIELLGLPSTPPTFTLTVPPTLPADGPAGPTGAAAAGAAPASTAVAVTAQP